MGTISDSPSNLFITFFKKGFIGVSVYRGVITVLIENSDKSKMNIIKNKPNFLILNI